ncbi:hypothetical protein BSK53_00570 [Paenibacillus odorifer]|nr:hypothetical protein BSK53_00570 [Paenibacillus odorifer]
MFFSFSVVVTDFIFDINNMFMGISLLLVIFICLLFIGIKERLLVDLIEHISNIASNKLSLYENMHEKM